MKNNLFSTYDWIEVLDGDGVAELLRHDLVSALVKHRGEVALVVGQVGAALGVQSYPGDVDTHVGHPDSVLDQVLDGVVWNEIQKLRSICKKNILLATFPIHALNSVH